MTRTNTDDMYQYETVEVETPRTPTTRTQLAETIDEMASDGWRYVDSIKPEDDTCGVTLVFERGSQTDTARSTTEDTSQ